MAGTRTPNNADRVRGKHAAPTAPPNIEHATARANTARSSQGAHAASARQATANVERTQAPELTNTAQSGNREKKASASKKILIGVLAAIIALALICFMGIFIWLNSISSTISEFESEETRQELLDVLAPAEAETKEAYYIAVLGSDARIGDNQSRSDVTMMARIDPENGIVDLISIPRDTMVNIEGHGTQKINAAYSFGGAAGAVECISEFAGVPISHYVEVHFEELVEVVDQLGGIWVNIPENIAAGNGGMSFSKGEQLLDGEQALAFARERYAVSGGDFGRAMAQRMIIEAIANKVLECTPAQLPSVIGNLAACITTTFTVPDMVQLALDFQDTGLTIYSAACPSYSYHTGGVSYVGTMYAEWQDMMRRVDAGLNPEDTSVTIPEPQASDTTLGAATNGASPRDYEALAESAGLTTEDVAIIS